VADECFPSLSVNEATLGRADDMAARKDVPSGLRRIASDRADDLRRALAVRTGGLQSGPPEDPPVTVR
jgi:aminopeptidase N